MRNFTVYLHCLFKLHSRGGNRALGFFCDTCERERQRKAAQTELLIKAGAQIGIALVNIFAPGLARLSNFEPRQISDDTQIDGDDF